MSPAAARTFSFEATSPRPVGVEVEVHHGPPAFSIVGLPERAVTETRERLRAAIAASGFEFPRRRVLVKVSPTIKAVSDGRFDLPIATALLVASGRLRWAALARLAVVGELAPDGTTRPVSALSLTARAAHDIGADALLIPAEQMEEGLASLSPGLELVPVGRLAELPRLAAEWPPSLVELNHCVVTGRLRGAPEAAEGPRGDRVTLLRLDFFVQDPDEPERLWTRASCDVEVPDKLARQADLDDLRAGVSVLAAGQLSDREVFEDGVKTSRNVVLASLVKAGPPPDSWEAARTKP